MGTTIQYTISFLLALNFAINIVNVDSQRFVGGGSQKPLGSGNLSYSSSKTHYQPSAPAAPIGWNIPKQQGSNTRYQVSEPAISHLNAPPIGWNVPKPQGNFSYGGSNTHYKALIPAATHSNAAPIGWNATKQQRNSTAHRNVHAPIPATNAGHGQYLPASYDSKYNTSGGAPAVPRYPVVNTGRSYIPAGVALPTKSSSSHGFVKGLAVGTAGGVILGHALTPSKTVTHVVAPSSQAAVAQAPDNKIIIIDNGPSATVSTTNRVRLVNTAQARPREIFYVTSGAFSKHLYNNFTITSLLMMVIAYCFH